VLAVQIVAELSAKSFYRRANAQRLAVAVCASLPCIAAAGALDDSRANPRVDEIVTTGVRQQLLAELPRSGNIITAEDIALSPAANLVDLLSREANLNLRSLYGNTKRSGVDIRGQGDTYTSNVLVMVDGIQLNASDLSGADFSSIPLGQVERIEVIRGANTVRYGGGAVGGVVNIITKEPGAGINMNANARGGSYSTYETGLGISWSDEILSFGAEGTYQDSDGYRDNSDLENKDLSAKFAVTPVDWFKAEVTAQWHRDEYGLPGGVTKQDFDGSGSDREKTYTPLNGGETDDDRYRLDLALGNAETGILSATGSTRDRDNDYVLLAKGDTVEPDRSDKISEDETRLEVQYDRDLSLFGRQHSFTAGLDLLQTDFSRDEYSRDRANKGDLRQTAWFVAGDYAVSDTLNLSLGYRQDKFRNDRGTYVSDCDPAAKVPAFPFPGLICPISAPKYFQLNSDGVTRETWRNSALEAGVVWSPSEQTNWFVSYAQSFRNPNTDELVVADDDLGPQTGDHVDVGVRHRFGAAVEWNFALFWNENEDEILYGIEPITFKQFNRNSDEKTERYGGETDLRWYALPSLMLAGNLGYTHARFKETDTEVPLVPQWTGSISAFWQPARAWTIAVIGNYVDERYEGLDLTNTGDQLDDYIVVDTKVSYEAAGLQFYAGVNNVFDEVYATAVYGSDYYAMPDRNYYAGIAYQMSK
jgi:iron complex outermembrane receptor protein